MKSIFFIKRGFFESRGYSSRMLGNFRPAEQSNIRPLGELATIVRLGQRLCLLCYERDPAQCHRRRLAEIMHERTGAPIKHLIARLA